MRAPRPLDPELADRLSDVITGYRPNRANSDWATVRPFVVECVLRMHPRTFSTARRLMTITALYVSWALTVSGCELVGESVIVDSLMHRYLSSRLSAHCAMYRFDTARQLSTISEVLTGEPARRLHTPFQSPRVRPYSSNEAATLWAWANTLSAPLRREQPQVGLDDQHRSTCRLRASRPGSLSETRRLRNHEHDARLWLVSRASLPSRLVELLSSADARFSEQRLQRRPSDVLNESFSTPGRTPVTPRSALFLDNRRHHQKAACARWSALRKRRIRQVCRHARCFWRCSTGYGRRRARSEVRLRGPG